MRPIQLTPLGQEALAVLHGLYRTTKDVRVRTRAQMILLAAEHGMGAPAVAKIVREHEQTVRNWFKRDEAEGAEGLKEAPRPGSPRQVTQAYRTPVVEVVRMRPRRLGLPSAMWTLARVADDMAEQTGIRVEAETVRASLKAAEMVLRRPQHQISSPAPEYQGKKRRSQPRAMACHRKRSSPMRTSTTSHGCQPSEPWGVRKDNQG